MLNLRQLSESEARSACNVRTISTPMFRVNVNIADNMGEPLDHGWGTGGDDEPSLEEVSQGEEERCEGVLRMRELPLDTDNAGPAGHQSV